MVEEWENIPDSTLINLVESMKRRCELVTEKNGERNLTKNILIKSPGFQLVVM